MEMGEKRQKNSDLMNQKTVKENEFTKESTDKTVNKGGVFCDICGKKFRSKYHLKLHVPVHTGEKNYICGICKKGYQQKWNLVTHVARVHSKEKPFKCNDCGRAFGYSSHFKRHVKSHFLEKIQAPDPVKKRILNPYKCRHCDKSFESNYRLDLHQRTHAGGKLYECKNCGKSFLNKKLWEIHFKKKHGEQPDTSDQSWNFDSEQETKKSENEAPRKKKQVIACEVCGKGISRESVKKHLNIHYKERVYFCRFCKKEFFESGQRMVHERKHTGEKPYLCDVCGKSHSQYGNLLTHRKRCHNLTEKTPMLWKLNSTTRSKVQNLDNSSNKKRTALIGEFKCGGATQSEASRLKDRNDNPECTGNETIEEFVKIAATWANKKYQESKMNRNDPNFERHGVEFSDPNESVISLEPDTSEPEQKEAELSNQETGVNEKSKSGESLLKAAKVKINRIIFEKIFNDLKESSIQNEVLEVVAKIKSTTNGKNEDLLREFLRKMKKVPDNVVMKTKDGKLFWHCWMCESSLRSRHLLARHLFVHEPEENRPYKCQICNKTFIQSNNFKEHTMTHYNENQFYCEKCGNGFRHKSHFNMHMKRHNSNKIDPLPKKHQCGYCGKKVNTNYQKIEHERTHTKEKPYLCKVCGQQFGAVSTLNRHHSTHSSASHQCAICLKFFRQKSSLKRHHRTHYECSVFRVSCECGKTFSQTPSLKKHKLICKNRTEPIVKPFSCLVCTKRFTTKSDLKRHVTTHDTLKRFRCSVCLTYLKTNETFKRHMSRHKDVEIFEEKFVAEPEQEGSNLLENNKPQ